MTKFIIALLFCTSLFAQDFISNYYYKTQEIEGHNIDFVIQENISTDYKELILRFEGVEPDKVFYYFENENLSSFNIMNYKITDYMICFVVDLSYSNDLYEKEIVGENNLERVTTKSRFGFITFIVNK